MEKDDELMAPRRKLDPTMLETAVTSVATQEVSKGTPRSEDPNFGVFATPINEDILVYIPRGTWVVEGENGSETRYLKAWLHDVKEGKMYKQLRSIRGLTADQSPAFKELGYDGECPLDEATKEEWELYNIKLEAALKAAGLTLNDPDESIKPIRKRILDERTIKNAEEYITFPVCIIPRKDSTKPAEKMFPADDALDGVQVVFVTWRKDRYEKSLLSVLDVLPDAPTHPAGLFFFWKFTYDTKGKPATARDSAREATYNVVQQQATLDRLEPLREALEAKAIAFTPEKAAEVIVANQFWYKEDLQAEVDKFMSKVRAQLRMARGSEGEAPALNAGSATAGLEGGNPLSGFVAPGGGQAAGASNGITITPDDADMGVASTDGAPLSL